MSIGSRIGSRVAALAVAAAVLVPGQAWAADTVPPTAPSGLRVVSVSFTGVHLAWNAGSDNSGWVQYVVEVRALPMYLQRWGALETTKRFTGLPQGVTFTATVWTRDGANNESAGVSIQFTTPVDTTAPAAPGNLREVGAGDSRAIAWDAAQDDSQQIGYQLWSGSELILSTGDLGVTVFDLVDNYCLVLPGTTHTFTVRAVDVGGNWSPPSNAITMSFPA